MKKDIIVPILLIGAFLLLSNQSGGVSTNTTAKRQQLIQYVQSGGDSPETKQRVTGIFQIMSDAEINAVYVFIFDYVKKERKVPAGSLLQQQIAAISAKYNIFT